MISSDCLPLLTEAAFEAERAKRLFPSPAHLTLALAEEAGEAVKAAMDMRQKSGTREALEKELVQTIAMCIRLYYEGDPSIGIPAYTGITRNTGN